ncbi:MAG TPA: ester cyclase [Solirubrobacterales bacterium]
MAKAETTVSRTTTEVVDAYFDALRRRDLEAAAACWRPGGIDNLHGMAELRAPDDIKSYFGDLFAAFPDFEMVVASRISEGDKAAVRWTATGTFDGDTRFEGMTPNGASVEVEGLDLLTVSDGLIVENRAYTNGMELARQLGALPERGSAQEKAMLGAVNLRTAIASRLRRR